MKVQFGTTSKDSKYRAIVFNLLVFITMVVNLLLATNMGTDKMLALNITSESFTVLVKDKMGCTPFYEWCWCPYWLQKTNDSYYCAIEACRRYFRPLVLIMFVLQVCVVRELFTCIGHSIRILVHIMYIASFLTLSSFTVAIYWSDCFHTRIGVFLHCTSAVLNTLGVHDLRSPRTRESSPEHHAVSDDVYLFRRNEQQVRPWKDIV